jgi:hypothetical protein
VDARAGLDAAEKKNFLCACRESNPDRSGSSNIIFTGLSVYNRKTLYGFNSVTHKYMELRMNSKCYV